MKTLFPAVIISFLFCFIVQLYNTLLQYDKLLFEELYKCENTQDFDLALNALWRKKIQKDKTIEQRFVGTRKLISQMVIALLCQLCAFAASVFSVVSAN